MAKKNSYQAMTIEDLQKKQKQFKAYVGILSIVTLAILAALVYFAIKSNNFNLAILCGASSFSLLLCSVVLKQIETEIKSRNLE